jgi:hypothetical protein
VLLSEPGVASELGHRILDWPSFYSTNSRDTGSGERVSAIVF